MFTEPAGPTFRALVLRRGAPGERWWARL